MCGCNKSHKKNNFIKNGNIKNNSKTVKQLLEEQQKILGVIPKK
jgi:hypothetical protein